MPLILRYWSLSSESIISSIMSCFSPPKLSNNICKANVFLSQGKLDVFGHTRQGHWAEDAKEPKTLKQ